jgi:protein ImuA
MSLPIHLQAAPRPRDLQPLAGDLTLQRGRLHEFCGPSRLMLAAGVMARSEGPVVWIRPGWWPERLNAAGLQPLANPARLLLVRADRDEAALWAAEEALRSGAVPLVVVETAAAPGLTPVRRLHLAAGAGVEAAHQGGTTAPLGLILTPGQGGAPGVETRWHLAPQPSRNLLWSDEAAWTLSRLRARLAPPARWRLSRKGGASDALEQHPPDPDPCPIPERTTD